MTAYEQSGSPNIFNAVTVGYGDTASILPLTELEQGVLAASADRFPDFADEVRARDRDARQWPGTPDATFPPEVEHLGDGFETIGFGYEHDGSRYVVRVPNYASASYEDGADWERLTQQRLLALARVDVHDVPHLERLVTHSLVLGEQGVVTTRGGGKETKSLTPHELLDIPEHQLRELFGVAARMTEAGLIMDVDKMGDWMALAHCNATYDQVAGPTYFDFMLSDDPSRTSDQNYVELVQELASIGQEVGEPLDAGAAAARVLFLEKGHKLLQEVAPDSPSLAIFARTANLLTDHVSEEEFTALCEAFRHEGHLEGDGASAYQLALTGNNPVIPEVEY